jgi:hypothetical protein
MSDDSWMFGTSQEFRNNIYAERRQAKLEMKIEDRIDAIEKKLDAIIEELRKTKVVGA